MPTEIIVLPAMFGMLAFVVWVIVNGWQRRQHVKAMAEFHGRLIERIGSVKDFSDFLQTEGGVKFMDALTVERGSTGPRDRILRAVQSGVVCTTMSGGFLGVGLMNAFGAHEEFTVLGIIVLSLGLGLLLSSGAAYWVARTLGLINGIDSHSAVGPVVR
jgi:hypothetical protein